MTQSNTTVNQAADDEFDMGGFDDLEIETPDIEYQEQDDSGCEGGACKI